MNITAIRTFLTVVRSGNLNRAADQLNVTQSAITARLDTLEQALGTKLLVRSRKGATLTKPGFAFVEQAEVIVRSWDSARARATLPHGVTRLFSFVTHPALWTGLGDKWIDDLRTAQPETAVEIWSGLTVDAKRWLQSGMSDAALLPEPLTDPELVAREFSVEDLVQVASRPREVMEWDPDYIYVDYGPTFRAQHAQTWPGDNTAALSYSNPDWALSHLLSQGGSAYLPASLIARPVATGLLFLVDKSPRFTRRSYLSWRKSSETTFPWLSSSPD